MLLNQLQGNEHLDREVESGTEGQDITKRLGLELQGQRCLIWLDNVQDPSVVDACAPMGFAGALLVTANRSNAKATKINTCLSMHITSDVFWTAAEESGDLIAAEVLAARVADDKKTDTFPPGCEVRRPGWIFL